MDGNKEWATVDISKVISQMPGMPPEVKQAAENATPTVMAMAKKMLDQGMGAQKAGVSRTAEPAQPLRIKIPPAYDFAGPTVDVGRFSDGLASRDKKRFLATIREMGSKLDELPAEAMYVAAIRLYDYRMRDAAVYWFYSAQYRATLVRALADRSGPSRAEVENLDSFEDRAGRAINACAFCDRKKLTDTLQLVARQQDVVPDLKSIYPRVPLAPASLWVPVNLRVASGFQALVEVSNAHWADIQARREGKGMNARYCR